MNTNLTASVEQLLQRRVDLLREVTEIDTELERVKLALQGAHPQPRQRPIRTNFRRDIRAAGSIPNDIYAALAVREPRSAKDLAAHLKLNPTYVGVQCKAMADAGRLHRVRLHNRGRTYFYARTADVLIATSTTETPASDDELGQRNSANSVPQVGDSISLATDISHA